MTTQGLSIPLDITGADGRGDFLGRYFYWPDTDHKVYRQSIVPADGDTKTMFANFSPANPTAVICKPDTVMVIVEDQLISFDTTGTQIGSVSITLGTYDIIEQWVGYNRTADKIYWLHEKWDRGTIPSPPSLTFNSTHQEGGDTITATIPAGPCLIGYASCWYDGWYGHDPSAGGTQAQPSDGTFPYPGHGDGAPTRERFGLFYYSNFGSPTNLTWTETYLANQVVAWCQIPSSGWTIEPFNLASSYLLDYEYVLGVAAVFDVTDSGSGNFTSVGTSLHGAAPGPYAGGNPNGIMMGIGTQSQYHAGGGIGFRNRWSAPAIYSNPSYIGLGTLASLTYDSTDLESFVTADGTQATVHSSVTDMDTPYNWVTVTDDAGIWVVSQADDYSGHAKKYSDAGSLLVTNDIAPAFSGSRVKGVSNCADDLIILGELGG